MALEMGEATDGRRAERWAAMALLDVVVASSRAEVTVRVAAVRAGGAVLLGVKAEGLDVVGTSEGI